MPGMRILLANLLLLTLGAFQAKAELTVKDYKAAIASAKPTLVDVTKIYVKGLGEGMGWANVAIGAKKLFCQPGKLALDMQNYIQILDREIAVLSEERTQAELNGYFVGMVLMKGL